jgi:hypothetical protein
MSNLTPKQQKFLEAYLGEANFNATEAARLAGYKGEDNVLAVVGCQNLRKPNIAEELRKAWEERGMESHEIIGRLSDIGRASLADFIDVLPEGGWKLNLVKAQKAGKLHCLKKLKHTEWGTEIELWSPLDAKEKLARIRRLFADAQIEIDVNILNVILEALPIEQREQFSRAIEAAVSPGSLTADRR